jgi:uncharacterized protein YrrD
MQFTEGARVSTAEGEIVGSIGRVVLDPETKEVTHLVVQKGFLFTEDKVVPLSLIGRAAADSLSLRPGAGDLEDLPDFEESHYVAVERGQQPAPGSSHWARPLYWYPPVGSFWPTGAYTGIEEQRYVQKTEKNIPEGTVALVEGAQVISSDGEHVGDIERVLTDPLADRATHLLIAEGLFLKEKKLVPTGWMGQVYEDEIHLRVDSDFVDSLPASHLED